MRRTTPSKNEFRFKLQISQLSRSFHSVYWSHNLLKLNKSMKFGHLTLLLCRGRQRNRKDLYRTCTAIVLLIKPVWWRSPCRCRCSFFKLLKCISDNIQYLRKMTILNVVRIGIKAGFYKWHNHPIFRYTDANCTHFLFGKLILLS